MFDYLLSTEGLQDLMKLLLIACALLVAVIGFFRWCERGDELWKLDNPLDTDKAPPTTPRLYAVDPTNIDQVLAHMGVSEKDREDIAKGSKLS